MNGKHAKMYSVIFRLRKRLIRLIVDPNSNWMTIYLFIKLYVQIIIMVRMCIGYSATWYTPQWFFTVFFCPLWLIYDIKHHTLIYCCNFLIIKLEMEWQLINCAHNSLSSRSNCYFHSFSDKQKSKFFSKMNNLKRRKWNRN